MQDGSLFLTQSKYIQNILMKAGFKKARGEKIPMTSGLVLTKEGTKIFEDVALYRSVVGSLQYATITHPEISFSVNKVCQYMQKPFQEHWKAVKKILRYLAAFQNHGLKIVPTINRSIIAFCDASAPLYLCYGTYVCLDGTKPTS